MAFDIYRVRDVGAGAANPDPDCAARVLWAQGTLSMQRRFTNHTGQAITRLRFRIYDITTLGSQASDGLA